LKLWTYIYEIFTWPFYYLFQSKSTLSTITTSNYCNGSVLAKPIINDDPKEPWRNLKSFSGLVTTMIPGCNTLDDLMIRASDLWPDKRALGTRKLVKSEMEPQANKKLFKKLTFEKYYWETYGDINKRINNFGKGLLKMQMKPGISRILIFAETRSEWMIAAQTCFRFNIPIVTLYSTLGDEAIVHGIIESEASVVVTSEELMSKLCKVIDKCPSVQHVVFMNNYIFEGCGGKKALDLLVTFEKVVPDAITLHEMSAVEQDGENEGEGDSYDPYNHKPTRDSLAIIMYTSGSTDKPKGVMMTHSNLMSAMAGQFESLPPIHKNDTYIGYLPLAHVLELCCENVVLSHGIPVGYSSPLTLTDKSSKIKSKTKGDISSLKPTIMACVPTILDRITKSVWEKATDNGPLFLEMFRWAYEYKMNRMDRGYPSVFMDRFVFAKIKKLLGGRVRYMLSGGAPLSEEAQNFINICFCPIIQGYGLTETCGAGTLMVDGDRRPNQVGIPLNSLQIQLREWKDGNYAPTDKPKPRGEILIGGDSVTQGYFKQPEKTKEDFYVDGAGMRWFCTGDIGVFHCDGSLSIIDRKKDLVKLQAGEYISLAKVELAISTCPVVETVCVYAESTESYVICFISPKQKQLMQIAEKLNINETDFKKVCKNKEVINALLKQIQKACLDKELERVEIPNKLYIDHLQWTPDTGLVTDALKLKRRDIQLRFTEEIKTMYMHH